MCLLKKFKTLRTIIFRGGLTGVSPNEVLGDVMTDVQYNDSENEDEEKKDKKEKSVAFKASSLSYKGKSKKEASSEDVDDFDGEAMALLVRKMGKFMKKRGYGARKRRDHMKEYVRLCFECKSSDHIAADCLHKRNDDENEKKKKKNKKKKKEKKMTFKKKKKKSGYVVTWDSDGSNDSDDDKRSIKKALASIAIHNKPSLFDTPSTCLIAKPTKVKYDGSDDECDSDDYGSNDEDFSKEELIDICEQLSTGYKKKRKECKELLKKLKALEKSFRELQASHECLKEDHEELGLAHTKLEKAHSSLLEHAKEKEAMEEQVIVTCDVGLTCDLIDESFHSPIIFASTNPSCSSSSTTTNSTSTTSDSVTCDASLLVENETLKKEVDELTHILGKAYGGEVRLLKCLGS
jgi:hypothetical protein